MLDVAEKLSQRDKRRVRQKDDLREGPVIGARGGLSLESSGRHSYLFWCEVRLGCMISHFGYLLEELSDRSSCSLKFFRDKSSDENGNVISVEGLQKR